jgi:hypothetical protein
MLVGGRDDAHVNAHRTRRADPRHLAIFDRAQQPVLGRAGQRGELVQEQGAAVGFLEPGPGAPSWRRVKAPDSWPNSSASINVSGKAAQLRVMSGPSQRPE